MDMMSAVRLAKKHIADLYEDEGISKIGLEQVEYDETNKQWDVTIGFTSPNAPAVTPKREERAPMDFSGRSATSPADFKQSYLGNRRFKVVEIEEDSGRVITVRDLFLSSAA